MSYKENNDYININLKRVATEDEIQVLNKFWNIITPKCYLKSVNSKIRNLFSRDMFFEKPLNSLEIKGYEFIINSCRINEDENIGNGLNKSLKFGVKPDGVIISSKNNENDIKKIGEYFHCAGISSVCMEFKEKQSSYKNTIFSFNLSKKNKIKKQKIKNGLNVVIVGTATDINTETEQSSPFIHKKLTDLVIEAFNKKVITAVETCENGIFTAIAKLIKQHKWGIFVNLDNLHKKEQGYSAFEYLNSTSPERLIFGVQNRKLVEFLTLVDKYELPFSIIGKIDKSKSVRVVNKNLQVIHLNKTLIFNPLAKINNNFDEKKDNNCIFGENITNNNVNQIIENSEFISKKKFYRCFNSIIGNRTSFLSKENGIGELWYQKIKYFISYSINSDSLQLVYNPYVAGQNAVCEAYRKLYAFGHEPIGVYVNCYVDFSKNNAINLIKELRNGIYYASKKLRVKVLNIVLNDSKEEEFNVVLIGKKKKREKLYVPYFENAQKVYVIGKPDNLPATSLYQKILGNNIYPYPDEINFRFEKNLLKCVKELQKRNQISAIIPIDRFGIAGALVKALSPQKLGFKCNKKDLNLNYMFNEIQSRFLISTNQEIETVLKKYKIPFIELGKTKTADYIELSGQKISCKEFYENYFRN